jgi:hypothetical protein
MSNAYILLEKEMLDLAHFLTEETNVLTKQETEERAKELVSDLRKIQPKLNDSNHQQRVQLLIDDLQRD